MAYHRSSHSARGLNNSFRRRQALLKRILQERAESASSSERTILQAVIIAPGGTTNLQLVDSIAASSSEAVNVSRDTSNRGSSGVNPQTNDSHPSAYVVDTTGQVPLEQTQTTDFSSQTSPPAPRTTLEDDQTSPTELAAPRITLHPSHSQPNSFRQASPSPPVAPLVVSPIPASLPPLLSSNAFASGTRSSPAPVASSANAVDPVSTGSNDTIAAPPLSQNPPIIVGILLVVVLVMAAAAALVSWLTRSALRQRKYRLEALTFKTNNSEEALSKMDSHLLEETDVEEGMGYLNHLRTARVDPVVPFYVEPHSTIFTHENYPADEELPDNLRAHEGAYLPAIPPTKIASHQNPRNDLHFGIEVSRHAGFPPPTRTKVHPGPWKHSPHFLDLEEDGSLVPEKNERSLDDQQTSGMVQPSSFSRPLEMLPLKEPTNPAQHHNLSGISWANALRYNLVSTLDVIKHAASDRMLQAATTSRPDEPRSTLVDDRFTPVPLRPGRKLHGRALQRRSTQEERDLAFGGGRSPTGLNTSRSSDHCGDESEEEEGLGELESPKERKSAQNAVGLGGLGRFSFEQRMGKDRSQTLSISSRQERRNVMIVHSTALSRRRSGMASGSGSSSHSAAGSDLGAGTTIRKRRSNVA